MAPLAEDVLCIEGRRAYFWALERHWPEVLKALQVDVLPWYEPRWHEQESGRIPITESWSRLKTNPEHRQDLLAKLEGWAERFLITEEWIFDAALDTLLTYRKRKCEKWFWRYNPRGFHPRFEPVLPGNFWYPPLGASSESWEHFKKRMQGQFRRQLAGYRTTVETRFGVGREKKLQIEAGWTARYQKGESVIETVQTINIGELADPEQTTYRAIERFSKSVGLKLRRRGQRPKRTSVHPTP